MNYYPFHVGDYAAHTKHLTLMGDLAYRRLLDLYYISERPLPLDPAECARRIGMRDQIQDVSEVLSDFFLKSEEGWVSKRADEEIAAYKAKSERAKAANTKRWKGKNSNTDLKSDLNTDLKSETLSDPNQEPEPITNISTSLRSVDIPRIEEPAPSAPRKRDAIVLRPDGVDESVWQDFAAHRKRKRAQLTQTALDGIATEARKAGVSLECALRECLQRGWTGFKADWLKPEPRGSPARPEKFNASAYAANPTYRANWDAAKRSNTTPATTIDVDARIVG